MRKRCSTISKCGLYLSHAKKLIASAVGNSGVPFSERLMPCWGNNYNSYLWSHRASWASKQSRGEWCPDRRRIHQPDIFHIHRRDNFSCSAWQTRCGISNKLAWITWRITTLDPNRQHHNRRELPKTVKILKLSSCIHDSCRVVSRRISQWLIFLRQWKQLCTEFTCSLPVSACSWFYFKTPNKDVHTCVRSANVQILL